jgi:hypothetical protein
MALQPTINLPEVDVAFWFLLTIKANKDTIRVVNNYEDVVSRGDTFMAYPFALALPADDGEAMPELMLNIDNVDQRLVKAIRELLEPPDVTFEMVLSSAPDTVERTIDFLRADFVSYDAMGIQMRLRPNSIMGRNFPTSRYLPGRYPDLAFR